MHSTSLSIPSLLCNLYLYAFAPLLIFTLPPNLFCIYSKHRRSSIPIVISKLVYPCLLTCKQPSPSITPANHSLNSVSGVTRVVSEVPTRLLFSRPWLPADWAPALIFLLHWDHRPLIIQVINAALRPFQHIA